MIMMSRQKDNKNARKFNDIYSILMYGTRTFLLFEIIVGRSVSPSSDKSKSNAVRDMVFATAFERLSIPCKNKSRSMYCVDDENVYVTFQIKWRRKKCRKIGAEIQRKAARYEK